MDRGSVVRLLVLIGSLLTYFRIDVPETTIEMIASLIVSAVGIYTAYKNNYLFSRGLKQKEVLKSEGLYKEMK